MTIVSSATGTIVSEEDTPLPYCFHGDNMPRPLDHVTQALDERIGTLKRGKSFLKRTSSLRRNKRYMYTD